MTLSPDEVVWWAWGNVRITATLGWTWIIMAAWTAVAAILTRHVESGEHPTRWQVALEVLVGGIDQQVQDVTGDDSGRFLPFLATLFLFIATSNLLGVVPGYLPPTGSLSTTTALALTVFVAVPYFGISRTGVKTYFSQYIEPSPFMLPFNIIGELSRTLALAVRLFGNIMSGSFIGAILLSLAPLFFPVLMQVLGLLTGLIQAYIFAVLAGVFIASAAQVHAAKETKNE